MVFCNKYLHCHCIFYKNHHVFFYLQIKIGYFIGYIEFSVKSELDGRLILRGNQNKFLPIGKYPKLWELATKCTPLVSALFDRDFSRKQLDTECWSGLLSIDGQHLHFEDLFASNGEGKMMCTPKTQNWVYSLQGMKLCSSSSSSSGLYNISSSCIMSHL